MLLNSTKMQSDNMLQFEIPPGLQSRSELAALKIKGQRRSPDRRGAWDCSGCWCDPACRTCSPGHYLVSPVKGAADARCVAGDRCSRPREWRWSWHPSISPSSILRSGAKDQITENKLPSFSSGWRWKRADRGQGRKRARLVLVLSLSCG